MDCISRSITLPSLGISICDIAATPEGIFAGTMFAGKTRIGNVFVYSFLEEIEFLLKKNIGAELSQFWLEDTSCTFAYSANGDENDLIDLSIRTGSAILWSSTISRRAVGIDIENILSPEK